MSNGTNIKYSDCYVAFLDILGFKKLVINGQESKINEYFQVVEEILDFFKVVHSKKDIGSIIISDSVILSIPVGRNTTEQAETLRELCFAIQEIQFGLAKKNIWLRGAISYGEAYFSPDKHQVVGKAYIDAYLLETKVAVYPRVILDNRIIKFLGFDSAGTLIEGINYFEPAEHPSLKNNVLYQWRYQGGHTKSSLKNDVPLFVDYLVCALENESSLKRMIDNIETTIYSDNGIYSKFRWVADYLIALIEHHKSFLGDDDINHSVLMENLSRLRKL